MSIDIKTTLFAYVEPSEMMLANTDALYEFCLKELDESITLLETNDNNQTFKTILIGNIIGSSGTLYKSGNHNYENEFVEVTYEKIEQCKADLKKLFEKYLDKITKEYPDFNLEQSLKFGIANECF